MTGLGEGLRAPAGKLLRAATLVAVAAFLFRIDFLLSVAALLVLLWAVSVWWPDRALRNVHTQRAHPRRIFHDEEATVTLTVRNDGRLPLPWLEVSDVVPFDLNLVVGGGRHPCRRRLRDPAPPGSHLGGDRVGRIPQDRAGRPELVVGASPCPGAANGDTAL